MSDDDGRNPGAFKEGNTASMKSGVEKAIKHLSSGLALTGTAREYETAARLERESDIERLAWSRCDRLQAVADLCFDALEAAAQAHDHVMIDRLLQRFGWLQTAASRERRAVQDEVGKMNEGTTAKEVLDSLKEDTDGGNS